MQFGLPQTTVFGIVGGVGSGKSYTTSAFVAHGAACFDADQEAKALYEDQETLSELRRRWPSVVKFDNSIDRAALASIVFAPTVAGRQNLEYLNDIFRPRIFNKFEIWLKQVQANGKEFAIFDAPLLLEAGWDSQVDYIVYVDASETTRQRRVLKRGWNLDELKKREACQIPLNIKKKRADFIVSAEFDDSQMDRQTSQIIAAVRRLRKNVNIT